MPTYSYTCENGHEYEEVRGISEDQQVFTCVTPLCGTRLKRKFTAPTITFSGPGFNTTRG